VLIVVSCTVIITVSSLIVRCDERRLQRAAESGEPGAEKRLERSWSAPSRDNALIGLALLAAPLLGLFAVWFHFFRTRLSVKGFALGVAAVVVVMIANAAIVLPLAWLVGLPLDD